MIFFHMLDSISSSSAFDFEKHLASQYHIACHILILIPTHNPLDKTGDNMIFSTCQTISSSLHDKSHFATFQHDHGLLRIHRLGVLGQDEIERGILRVHRHGGCGIRHGVERDLAL